ncbi:MAG: ribbon-helix-helix protein, CopG family [Phycisphaeraceae bacterium]|nr:ribbon-helix-helix protein, CopG family [Myxococcales bacterium]MCB9846751.1 ribbon-helix-helix protein, CopG family [Phycisphaeraceae bacterium]
MARTNLHLPQGLLEKLDELAKQRGSSRNRLTVDACRGLVQQDRGEWPEGSFADERLSPEDLEELRAGAGEMMDVIRSDRRSRSTPPS